MEIFKKSQGKYVDELKILLEREKTNEHYSSKFWISYQKDWASWYIQRNFANFRSETNTPIRACGQMAAPDSSHIVRLSIWDKIHNVLFPHKCRTSTRLPRKDMHDLDVVYKRLYNAFALAFYHYVDSVDSYGYLKLLTEDRNVGDPADLVKTKSGEYISVSVLFKYLHYLYIRQLTNIFPKTVIEFGAGVGFMPFVTHRIHPETKILIVDLPMQLSTAYCYLDQWFPGEVAPYSEVAARNFNWNSIFSDKKIALISASDFNKVDMDFELGMGTATFQEMDLETVRSYMKFLNEHVTRCIYVHGDDFLRSHFYQKEKANLLELYNQTLSNFEIVDRRNMFFDPESHSYWFDPRYKDTFWGRKDRFNKPDESYSASVKADGR